MNGTTHAEPRPLRAPAVGSSVMIRSPLGLTARPKANEKPAAEPGPPAWLPRSNGRVQVSAQSMTPAGFAAVAPTAAGNVPPVSRIGAAGPVVHGEATPVEPQVAVVLPAV